MQPVVFNTHAEVSQAPHNPSYHGTRITFSHDICATGFSQCELEEVYYRLTSGRYENSSMLEPVPFDAVNTFWNPADVVIPDMILEAITIPAFSRTEARMRAVIRVMNKALSGSELGISAQDPIVGKPKKQGMFAYVTVQLPFSDGQSVSIIFHSPDGDKKKIEASDPLIAFRWLLNKRDITHVVAPEHGKEISLDEVSKRISQLVEKNHARFVKQQKMAIEEQRQLEELQTAVATLKDQLVATSEEMDRAEEQQKKLNADLVERDDAILSIKTENDELEAKIAELKAKNIAEDKVGNANDKVSEESDDAVSTSEPVNKRFPAPMTDRIKGVIADNDKLYAEAAEKGLNPIDYKQFMAEVNSGNRLGDTVKHQQENLAEYKKDLLDLEAGRITARKILGTGAKKTEAIKWLQDAINSITNSLANEGFTYSVNPTNYRGYLQKLLNSGEQTGFKSDEELQEEKAAREGRIAQQEKEAKELAHQAAKVRQYIQGTTENMRRPYTVQFLIKTGYDKTLVELSELNSIHSKYEYLSKKSKDGYGGVSRKTEENFGVSVDLNSALKKGVVFEHCEAKPRKGYTVFDFTIDLDGAVEPKEVSNTPASEHPSVVSLRSIVAGDYTGQPDAIDRLLDEAADQLEVAKLFDDFEDLLNQAADVLTVELNKKAQEVE